MERVWWRVARPDGHRAGGYWNGRAGVSGREGPGRTLHGACRSGAGTERPGRQAAACWRRGARAQRKPVFWFRFSGLFLFRFAERRFWALLLKAPPRSTRDEPEAGWGPTSEA